MTTEQLAVRSVSAPNEPSLKGSPVFYQPREFAGLAGVQFSDAFQKQNFLMDHLEHGLQLIAAAQGKPERKRTARKNNAGVGGSGVHGQIIKRPRRRVNAEPKLSAAEIWLAIDAARWMRLDELKREAMAMPFGPTIKITAKG